MIKKKSFSDFKPQISEKIRKDKELLKVKIDKFLLDNKEGKGKYHRRLDQIYNFLKEKCFMEDDKHSSIMNSSDLYQKLELFMSYSEDIFRENSSKEDRMDWVLEMIGQVFKAYYTLLVLNFLDEEEPMPLPYIGRFQFVEVEKFNNLVQRPIKYFYGRANVDKSTIQELRAIADGDKVDLIIEALENSEKIIREKLG